MNQSFYTRILALELRHRRVGFTVLERPQCLLDYGIRTYRSSEHLLKVIHPLLKSFVPCAIAVKQGDHKNSHHRKSVGSALRAIRAECIRRAIPIETVDVQEVRSRFRETGGTKEQIAAAIARMFPELHWKLPPTRHKRSWVSEGWNMVLFDAVATGLTFLERQTADPIASELQR